MLFWPSEGSPNPIRIRFPTEVWTVKKRGSAKKQKQKNRGRQGARGTGGGGKFANREWRVEGQGVEWIGVRRGEGRGLK